MDGDASVWPDPNLPLVLVGDAVVSTGDSLSRTQLARAVGRAVRQVDRQAV